MNRVFRIPPNQDAVIQRMLAAHDPLPAGWSLLGIDGSDQEIRGRYRTPEGRQVDVFLTHALADGGVPLSNLFSVRAPPQAAELVATLQRSVSAHEAGFRWQDVRAELALDEYLELTPYIDLEVEFDHEACLAEATALLDRFVMYTPDRRYRVRDWTGLALRAPGGDPTKVSMPMAPDSSYAWTPVADLCPRTMEMLGRVLDLDRGAAVNFLMLDPRGEITPHSDDTTFATMRSVNIALNMPPGCQFFLDTEPDGRHHRYTVEVPFKPGSAMLLNVARNHYVKNPANTPRIHIVARCPSRIPPGEILETGLRQSGLKTVEAMREALAQKYREQGRPVLLDTNLDRYDRKPLAGRAPLA
jgi:hypothetical protein